MKQFTAKPSHTFATCNEFINASLSLNAKEPFDIKLMNGKSLNRNFTYKLLLVAGAGGVENEVVLRDPKTGFVAHNIVVNDGKRELECSFPNILKALKKSYPLLKMMSKEDFRTWAVNHQVIELWETYLMSDWDDSYRPHIELKNHKMSITCLAIDERIVRKNNREQNFAYSAVRAIGGDKIDVILEKTLIHQFDEKGKHIKVHMNKQFAHAQTNISKKEITQCLSLPFRYLGESGSRWSLNRHYSVTPVARGSILQLGIGYRVEEAYASLKQASERTGMTQKTIKRLLSEKRTWAIYDPK